MKKEDFKFGEILFLKKLPKIRSGKQWKHIGLYQCFCGKEFTAPTGAIKFGGVKSCGCYRKWYQTECNKSHGESKTRLYTIWIDMKKRCNNPKNIVYEYYGGRGIKVCDEWINSFETFRDWALNHRYQKHLTIDRMDGNKNYCPENCRWVNMNTQNSNKISNKLPSSGFIGVHRMASGKFSANISIKGEYKYLGTFDTAEEASEAYQKAKKERDEMYLREEGFL